MQASEQAAAPQEAPRKKSTKAARSFELGDVIAALKSGAKKQEGFDLLVAASAKMTPEQRQPLLQHLVEQERCTPAFAERFLSDAALQKRVAESCRQFAGHGEQMVLLEEAEIFTELMDPGKDDIGLLLKTTNQKEKFTKLEPLDEGDLRNNRLWDLKNKIPDIPDVQEGALVREVFKNAFEQVGIRYTGTDADWQALFAKPDLMKHFLSVGPVKEVYQKLTGGKRVDRLGKRLQLTWRETPDGERVPAMHVQQMAVNPETNYVSELGFTIEKEQPREKAGEARRVIKDIAVVIDKDARNQSEGADFLLGNMGLIKAYRLHEAEFTANIKVGSYVWARIADADVPSMADALGGAAAKELGPKPWDEKKARGMVFRDEILPQFEKNLAVSIASVLDSIPDPKEKEAMRNMLVGDLMEKQYEAMKQRALAGEVTMEELVSLGKGLDVIRFNDEGELTRADDPEAKHYGHLGKASIMGVPWKARLALDTRSLFGLVDRLSKGTGLVSFLKKSGQKIGLALSL